MFTSELNVLNWRYDLSILSESESPSDEKWGHFDRERDPVYVCSLKIFNRETLA